MKQFRVIFLSFWCKLDFTLLNTISNNLFEVRNKLISASNRSNRNPQEVCLIGVSKTRSVAEVVDAVHAGLRDLGENRVQEAIDKRVEVEALLGEEFLKSNPLRWHMIGHLQSNKVGKAVDTFDVIHGIDSTDLARKINEFAAKAGKVLECYIQVNTSSEASKSGVCIEEVEALVLEVAEFPSLKLIGLMTIGPLTNDRDYIRSCFENLRDCRDSIVSAHSHLGELGLSMGMSDDFELAIECGSTAVRVGTALFGARNYL